MRSGINLYVLRMRGAVVFSTAAPIWGGRFLQTEEFSDDPD